VPIQNVIDVDNQHGHIAFIDGMQMDPTLKVVNMARGSLGKWVDEIEDADYGLIDRLINENHLSTIRHSYVTFFVQCPIFVKNQFIKHNVGGAYAFVDVPWNEISGRYVTYNKFWVPDAMHKKGRISKSGGTDEVHADSALLIERYKEAQQAALLVYMQMIEAGVAREEARTVLGLYVYTSFFVTGSMQYWGHFVSLRTAPDAQRHIRDYAVAIERECAAYFGYAWQEMMSKQGMEN
jgi:flavin-dependent thymidylate synthase